MHTLITWLTGAAILSLLFTATMTAKYWRDSKRSPYYFLRRQAEQRMQSFSLATIVSAVAILFLVSYAAQPQQDLSLRVAYITSAKPDLVLNEADVDVADATDEAVAADEPEIVEVRGANLTEVASRLQAAQNTAGNDFLASALTVTTAELAPALPPEYDQFSPTAELEEETYISDLIFSTEIDEVQLIALSPERVFGEGSYTIYATFDYEEMADGMVWSWVWRRDGQVVSGGNELWTYGSEGPGYVYYNPREGYSNGQYTLEIWVNGELMKQANLFITSDIAAFR